MSYFKTAKIRSKKIRQSARGKACTLRIPDICNGNPETTVFAHLPGNKGIGTKNHDLFGVYACSDCHDWADGRKKSKYDDRLVEEEQFLRALQETIIQLYQQGLIEVK